MAATEFVRFLRAMRDDPKLLARYDEFSLPQLLFHAGNEGFTFAAEDAADVVGQIEADVILNKDGQPFDGDSSLWRHMWGQRYLGYLVSDVLSRFSPAELAALGRGQSGEGTADGGQ
jgi:hypothetical protein